MKNIYLAFLFIASCNILLAQDFDMQNGTFNYDCLSNGSLFDSGGPGGNYGDNENLVITICPDTPGFGIFATMEDMSIEPGDAITIYNGDNTGAPSYPDMPLDNTTIYDDGAQFQSTVGNASGCLTFEFTSNGDGVTGNFEFSLDCEARCQTVISGLNFSIPDTVIEDGDAFINLCLGDTLFIEGNASFPENNTEYTQSEATSTFEWNWGDNTPTETGQTISHIFTEPGGYITNLTVTDINGCRNFQDQVLKIRVAPEPEFIELEDSILCLGETDTLTGLPQGTIINGQVVQGDTVYFVPPFFSGDSLFLPDGNGAGYNSDAFISSFGNNDEIVNCGDILEICVNIEHSFLGDLEMTLICPNGQSAILKAFPGGGGTYLGNPWDGAQQGNGPGDGLEYCFNSNGNGLLVDGPTQPATNTAGNTKVPGEYEPVDPFTNFIGCPINGQWTLNITDNLGIDDGFLFNWELNIAPCMFPEVDSFTMIYDFGFWEPDPTIVGTVDNANTIIIEPDTVGPYSYTYTTENQFGCEYQNTYDIYADGFDVIANPQDTTICGGETVDLLATVSPAQEFLPEYTINQVPGSSIPVPGNASTWNGAGDDVTTGPFGLGFTFNFFGEPVNQFWISSNGFITFSNPTAGSDLSNDIIPSPNGNENLIALAWDDLDPGNNSGVISYFTTGTAPNQQTVITFENVDHWPDGPNQATITSQIVLDQASGSITFNLIDINPDGTSSMTIGIENNDGTIGYALPGMNNQNINIDNESYVLSPVPSSTFFWTPNDGTINDTTIFNPQVSPILPTDYIVGSTNFNGCTYYDTVSIIIGGSFELEMPNDTTICAGESIQLEVTGGGQAYAWTPNNGSINDTTLSNPTFSPDTTTTYTVEVDSFGCTSIRNLTISVSDIQIDSTQFTDATCPNDADGTITVFASQGNPGYEYSIDNAASFQTDSIFLALDTGTYTLIVSDLFGCTDTSFATISEPDSLFVSNVVTDSVICFGEANGSIYFNGNGGFEPYEYSIDGGTNFQTDSLFENLSASNYSLVFRDSNLCISPVPFDTIIFEPQELVLDSVNSTNASCGASNGSITVSAAGGVEDYEFSLDGGITQPDSVFNGLSPGTYTISVTDANGCIDSLSISIFEDPSVSLALDSIVNQTVNCFGGTTSVSVSASAGTQPYTFFLVEISGTDTITQPDSLFTNVGAGNYTVGVIDINSCFDTITTIVSQPDSLILSAVVDSVDCNGNSTGIITGNAVGGINPYTFTLNPNAVSNNTGLFNGLVAGNYSVLLSDANGCEADSVSVIVEEPDSLLITNVVPNDLDCFGDTDGSFEVSATGGTPNYSYSLDNVNYQSSNLLNNISGGTYTIFVRDQNNCTTQVLDSIQEPAQLTISVDNTIDVTCNNGSDGAVQLSASGGTGTLTFSIQPGSATNTTGLFDNLEANSYIFTVTDANNCSLESGVVTINEPDAILATIPTPSELLCFGDGDGVIEISNVTGGTSPYFVNFDNGGLQPLNTPEQFTNLTAGSYSIEITDSANCPSFSQVIDILEPTELSIDSIDVTDLSCNDTEDGSVNIEVSGGTLPYDYNIVLTPGTDTLQNNNGVFNNLLEGNYGVLVEDANGCIELENFQVDAPPPVNLNIDTIFDETCFGYEDGQVQVSADGGVSPYTFEISSGGSLLGGSTFNNLDAGFHTITAIDDNGCTDEKEIIVNAGNIIQVNINNDSLVLEMGEELQFETSVDSAVSPFQYFWSPPTGLSCTDCSNPVVLIYNDETYSLTVTDSLGCVDEISVDVDVINEVFYFVPNAFTPGNNDNENDVFEVRGEDIKYVEMIIYNRIGEKVFESSNPYVHWDGTYKGVLQNPGVYAYYVKITFLNDRSVEEKGSVTLLR